jgi:hypothetical protein
MLTAGLYKIQKLLLNSPLHSQQVNLWFALPGIPIFEPRFVEGTVSSEVYVDVVVTWNAKINLTFQMCSS